MKNVWHNIKVDNSIVVGYEKIPKKKELLTAFENAIRIGGWTFIKWLKTDRAPYQCVINDGFNDIDVLLYLKAISNAGWEDKPQCKRVQVTNSKLLDLQILRRENARKINLIIGYYNYEKPIFAAWNPNEYTRHKTNRSCYVNVEHLIEGYEKGYVETYCFGQPVTVFTPDYLVTYIGSYINYRSSNIEDEITVDLLLKAAVEIYSALDEYNKQMNYFWDGKEKILEMKYAKSNKWKQMEWPGFYLEFLIEKILYSLFDFQAVKYGNTTFDLFNVIPWDLKVHTINSSNPTQIPTNDIDAINYAVEEFGYVGFIILEGEAFWDNNGEFKKWHDNLKGKKSKYQLEGELINRKSRRRKAAMKLKRLKVVLMDKDSVKRQPTFQEGMTNSDGKKRNPKMLLDLRLVEKNNILFEKEF